MWVAWKGVGSLGGGESCYGGDVGHWPSCPSALVLSRSYTHTHTHTQTLPTYGTPDRSLPDSHPYVLLHPSLTPLRPLSPSFSLSFVHSAVLSLDTHSWVVQLFGGLPVCLPACLPAYLPTCLPILYAPPPSSCPPTRGRPPLHHLHPHSLVGRLAFASSLASTRSPFGSRCLGLIQHCTRPPPS